MLEVRVLAGLRDKLMAPDAMAEAMRAFIEETNRLNHHRRASRQGDLLRLEKARKAIAGIVTAIEDGGYSRPLMERLSTLEADAEAIEQGLDQAPLDAPDVHPNVAEFYRRKVERLNDALNDPEDRTESATALRGLIDKIVLTPGAKRGETSAQLFGDLETVLAWAQDQGDRRREAAGLFPWTVEGGLSVAVGAEPCVVSLLGERPADRV